MNEADRHSKDPIRVGIPTSILALVVAAGLSLGPVSGARAQTDEWAKDLEKAPADQGTSSKSESSSAASDDGSENADASDNGSDNGDASDKGSDNRDASDN